MLVGIHDSMAQSLVREVAGRIVATRSDSRSVNIIDVNKDGWMDVFISNGLEGGQPDLLYINNGDGKFTPVIDAEIVLQSSPSVGASFGDFDNDGEIDGYVTTWYGQPNHLYSIDNSGSFSEVTIDGITLNTFSETAAWGDYDNDGLLDLYLTNSAGDRRNVLLHNDGQGQFTRILTGPMVEENDPSRNANWIDVNDDGLLDLYVTNESNTSNDLYLNTGNGSFTVYERGAPASARSTMSSSWGDIDNDGDKDLFIANSAFYRGEANQLYRNDNGIFNEITDGDIDDDGGCSFGSNFGDYDNDGDLDLFVTNGFCDGDLSNFLYENDGTGRFTNRSELMINAKNVCSYGAAWGDLNNDGFLDLVIANCKNRSDASEQSNSLFFGQPNSNNWYKIHLKGVKSNRDAIGAQVRLKATINDKEVWQTRDVSTQSGYSSQNSPIVHFGLGDAESVDSLVVSWPSGETTVITESRVNQLKTITEGIITSTDDVIPRDGTGSLQVFPNPVDPSQNNINLRIDLHQGSSRSPLKLTLVDSLGSVAYSASFMLQRLSSEQYFQINKSGMSPGIYVLYAVSGGQQYSKKIVIH